MNWYLINRLSDLINRSTLYLKHVMLSATVWEKIYWSVMKWTDHDKCELLLHYSSISFALHLFMESFFLVFLLQYVSEPSMHVTVLYCQIQVAHSAEQKCHEVGWDLIQLLLPGWNRARSQARWVCFVPYMLLTLQQSLSKIILNHS